MMSDPRAPQQHRRKGILYRFSWMCFLLGFNVKTRKLVNWMIFSTVFENTSHYD